MKTKTAILFTLLFLAGIQVSFGQSHLARKALAAPPESKNKEYKNEKPPVWIYYTVEDGRNKIEYYTQVFNVNNFGESIPINYRSANAFPNAIKSVKEEELKEGIQDYWPHIDDTFHIKEDAEQKRQEDMTGMRNLGWTVKELTIAVPNKTKSQKQMVYGGSAYVKVKNAKTGNEYYLVAAYSCNEHSIAEAKSFLRIKWLPNDWNTIKETPIHYSIDSAAFLDEDRKHRYRGTASVKVQNFKTGKIRTVHSVFPAEGDDKGDIKSRLTTDIVGQLNHQDENDDELITPITYVIEKKKE